MTMGDIEDLVVDFILNKGRHPKYILMDKNSYEEFQTLLLPLARFNEDGTVFKAERDNVVKIHITECQLVLLPVDVDRFLVEVI